MGIPETGIYYTDTKNLREHNNDSIRKNVNIQNNIQRGFNESQEEYSINSAVETYFNAVDQASQDELGHKKLPSNLVEDNLETKELTDMTLCMDDIKKIYLKCDETIDWTELLVSTSADDVFMEFESWRFLKSISRKVLSGDIDAYLETIEKMRPVEDLLDYGSDFEFGTDNSNSMEVEFRINAHNMLPKASIVGTGAYE